MPRSATTGVYTRISNSFSQPVFGTLIDPTDADAYFDDLDVGLNPPTLAGPTKVFGAFTVQSASASALAVGLNGATNPALQIDASTALQASGIKITGFATGNGTDLSVIDSGSDSPLSLNAKGTGAIAVGNTSTGGITLTRAVTLGSTINKLTLTAPATAATLTILNNKTATFNNSITFAGTDATTMTFPTTTATLARTDAGQTFAGTNVFGTIGIIGQLAVQTASNAAVAVGLNGSTNPSFLIDNSTALQVAGVKVTGAVTGGAPSINTIDSGSNAGLDISAKGSGAIRIAPASTGAIFLGLVGPVVNIGTSGTSTLNIGSAGLSGGVVTIAGSSSGALTVLPPAAASGTLNLASGTLTGSSASAVWFDNIPQNSQSAAYGLVLADAQKHIFHPSADTTARTWTIPANASVAYPIGTAITFVNQNAAGVITIAITTDTMRLAGAGTTGNRSLAANGIANAIKLTSTEWLISGTGLT